MEGFYPLENQCIIGALEGCQIYSSETQCQSCKPTYYMSSSGKCQKHELSSSIFCLNFSIHDQNKCDTCLSSRVKFSL